MNDDIDNYDPPRKRTRSDAWDRGNAMTQFYEEDYPEIFGHVDEEDEAREIAEQLSHVPYPDCLSACGVSRTIECESVCDACADKVLDYAKNVRKEN